MAKRAATADRGRSPRATDDAPSHRGLVALEGGPAAGRWYWRDWYLSEPAASWRRDGYRETSELTDNPAKNLRAHGRAVVWRFDPDRRALAGAPRMIELPAWKTTPAYCGCGERLLIDPDRGRCERCRLSQPTTAVWLYDGHGAMLASREEQRVEQFRVVVAERLRAAGVASEVADLPDVEPDDSFEDEPEHAVPLHPLPVSRPVQPELSADDIAAYAWLHLAPLYDR